MAIDKRYISKYPEIIMDKETNSGNPGIGGYASITNELLYDILHHTHSMSDLEGYEEDDPNVDKDLEESIQSEEGQAILNKITELTGQINNAKNEVASYSDKIDELSTSLDDTKSALATANQTIESQATSIEELTSTVESQATSIGELSTSLDEAKSVNESQAQKITELESALATANQTIESQATSIEELTSTVESQATAMDELKTSLDDYISQDIGVGDWDATTPEIDGI